MSRSSKKSKSSIPVVLTIAGSDSGGGAGIQADLKTFAALGVFGTTAITCVTAQNPRGVKGIEALSPGMVTAQITSVCDYFRVSAAKTGMLYSAPIIKAVALAVRRYGIKTLVVDPVMIATSRARLLKTDALTALCSDLLPLAAVVTPNLDEAEVLWGQRIRSVEDMKRAARVIGDRFGVACVVKGGHLRAESAKKDRDVVIDVLYDGKRIRTFCSPRVMGVKTHGTGCTFSAALVAFLGHGERLPVAVKHAKHFVSSKLRRG